MNPLLKIFLAKLVLVTFFTGIAGFLVFYFALPGYFKSYYLLILAFFFVVTAAIHVWQLRLLKSNLAKFSRANMLITFLKLFIYTVLAIACFFADKENAVASFIVIFSLYVVFSVVEVTSLMNINRKQNN